jgi:hypothetical protein
MKGTKLTVLIAALALLGLLPAVAGQSKRETTAHHRAIHSHQAKRPSGCPVHRNAEGDLIDCQGWRYRSSIGWDNTCFHLDYLPSSFACSPGGGGW